MKYHVIWGLLMALLLCACSDNSVDIVKNGRLDFDKSTTVGNALDNYPFFKATSWSTFQDQQKRTIVEFRGTFDLIAISKYLCSINAPNIGLGELQQCINNRDCRLYKDKWEAIIQFHIMGDNQFKVGFAGESFNGSKAGSWPQSYNNMKLIYQGQLTYLAKYKPSHILQGLHDK